MPCRAVRNWPGACFQFGDEMCLPWRANELGANVLPSGMTNDVSAGALAAGASSLGAPAQMPGAGGKVSNFARELGALDVGDATPEGQLVGPVGRFSLLEVDVAGDAVEGIKVPSLVDAATAAPAGDGSGLVNDALDALDEADGNVLPAEATEIQPGQETSSEDLPANEDGAADPLLALSTQPSAETILNALSPDKVVSDAALAGGLANHDASSADRVAVGNAGVSGPVTGLPAGAAPVFGAGLPEAGRPVSSAVGQAGSASPLQSGQAAADAGQGVLVPVSTNTRRWQSELPEELRASTAGTAQKQAHQQQGLPSTVPPVSAAAAGEGDLMPAGAAVKEGGLEKGAAGELARTAGEATKQLSTTSAPVASNDDGAQQLKTLPRDGATQNSVLATQPVAGSQAKDIGIPSGPLDVSPQAAATTKGLKGSDALVQPGGEVSPQAGKDTARAITDAGPDVKADTLRERLAAANTGAEAGARPEARLANVTLPAAAAALPAGLTTEKPDLSLVTADLSVSSEIGSATVRGGDLTGAMRTESLQTPNQAQSAQVASQVAAEIARNLKNGQTRFQMRFDPPELGRVEVNMKVGSDGSVQAHLIVERPETLDMFMRDQRGLERALEAAGLNPDSDNLQFSLKRDGEQQFASGNGQGEQSADRQDADGAEAMEMEPEVEDIVRMTLAQQRGGLDLKI